MNRIPRNPRDREGFTPKYDDGVTEEEAKSASNRPVVYMGQAAPPNIPYAISPRPVAVDVDVAESAFNTSDAYNRFLDKGSKDWIESLAKSIDYRRTGSSLWSEAVSASRSLEKQGMKVSPIQWLIDLSRERGFGGEPEPTGGTGGRAAAYAGPMESVQVAAETDIVAMAQATAQELLGRSATQQELDKILKRTRKAEQAQPQVQTRQGPGRVTTEEGLTKSGRDAILRKVLMQSPDYASYQFDSTVMDMMMDNLRRGQQVARG